MLRKISTSLVIISLMLIPLLISNGAAANYQGRKIVVFDETIVSVKARAAIIRSAGGIVTRSLPVINSLAVSLPDKASERALEGKVGVTRVDDDVIVTAKGKAVTQPAQTLEWGVNRIDADLAWATSKGTATKVAVIDTGIDKDHPDLVANIKGGVNFVKKGFVADPTKWDDDNGHGTHVAGIIAAADNTTGVIGTAPEANLYGVKVLDRSGSGYLSDVIAGIDWAINNDMDVINMSLGSDSDVSSFHDAVDTAYASGIVVVAAAGNDGSSVDYPGAYSSVIAVSATDINNNIASWSSRGPQVELAAPGVNIRSAWKGGGYKTISGTSMASPHVAGTAALVLKTVIPSIYDSNLDGSWQPAEVRNALNATADDLGTAGFDNLYGNGLVDAEESVTGVQTN